MMNKVLQSFLQAYKQLISITGNRDNVPVRCVKTKKNISLVFPFQFTETPTNSPILSFAQKKTSTLPNEKRLPTYSQLLKTKRFIKSINTVKKRK